MAELTKRFSAEFAIRPFIVENQDEAFIAIKGFAASNSEHVRRLASEGTRPRLPWGIRLQKLVKQPDPIFPILEQLIDDPSEYVRRSVANNLNDIAKDHPDKVVEFCSRYYDANNKNRVKLIKRACRTLIKNGDCNALAMLGFSDFKGKVSHFTLDKNELALGDKLGFAINVKSDNGDEQSLVIDYVIHYMKANGKQSGKVFKWRTVSIADRQTHRLEGSHHLKAVTTRKHYPGQHFLEVQINGKPCAKAPFLLL